MSDRSELIELHNRLSKTLDEEREAAREKRYEKGYRTARENLDDLVDKDSFSGIWPACYCKRQKSKKGTRRVKNRNGC